jgi:hypothetical protein
MSVTEVARPSGLDRDAVLLRGIVTNLEDVCEAAVDKLDEYFTTGNALALEDARKLLRESARTVDELTELAGADT